MKIRNSEISAKERGMAIMLCLLCCMLSANAQSVLNLDSCRNLALRNNKQLNISKLKKEVATNTRKAAHTKYLPKVSANGMYQFTSREISILNNEDKNTLSNLGTTTSGHIGNSASNVIGQLTQQGVISGEQAQLFGKILNQAGSTIGSSLNQIGQHIRDAFDTDTRNLFTADILITQPIFMGGAITAANRMAELSEQLADNSIENSRQSTIYETDKAYWLVVSLKQKQRLADSYLDLVKKLHSDVEKMVNDGIATKADGLKVAVKVNEAEMAKQKVDDGLTLAKMLLCQICGIDINGDITLADEDNEDIAATTAVSNINKEEAFENRTELKMLQNTIDISKENTKLVRAAYLPKVAAMGGYMMSNPCLYNGFERKFSGMFHVGVVVQVPVWSWFEGRYKMNATKAATNIAQMELNDAQEKIELQINQTSFQTREARKRLSMAEKNIESAKENLRCANIGFKEGIMSTTDVMTAQTAWLEAQSRKIDAEIDVALSNTNMKKVMGTLQ